MPLRVYNTLSQTKEPFQTVRPARWACTSAGRRSTPSHIGHMVGPVIFDTIKRYLVYLGYEVTWVVNITDVDDKLIVQRRRTEQRRGARREHHRRLSVLPQGPGVDGIDHIPKATEHIAEIIEVTQG